VSSWRTDQALDDGSRATADVEEILPGDGAVVLSFVDPGSGTPITTVAELWSVDPLPEPGDEVSIDIARDDPTRVALAGDRRRPTASLGFALGFALVPGAAFAARAAGVRRTERLMAAPGPSFSMLGVLRPSGRLRPQVVLDLYPLDTPLGGAPLCSVPLLHTGAVPLGRSYRVEVKGSPRPLGGVVARLGRGTMLWPRGRASWGSWPWAEEPELAPPGTLPTPTEAEPAVNRPQWTKPWESFPPVLAIALAGCAAFALMVTATTMFNRRVAAGADHSSIVVLGTVVERNPGLGEITVRYRPPDAADDLDAVLVAGDDDLHPEGTSVALRVDPDDDTNVRLASEPYDPVVPLALGWLPALGAGLAAAAWVSVARRNRRAAKAGWRRVTSWRLTGTDLLALAYSDAPAASCVARLPGRVLTGWPVESVGRRDVHAAGSLAPGDALAVRVGDQAIAPVWVAEAPPAGTSVDRPGGGAVRPAA
jgi:hypothetical protein